MLHGIYRVIGDLTYKKREEIYLRMGIDTKSRYVRMFRTSVTFALVCFAWIFFRANNVAELLLILKKLFTTFGISTFVDDLGVTVSGALIMILSIVIMVLLDRKLTLQTYTGSGAKLFAGTAMYLLWASIFAWLILLASNGSSAFIYFQF